MTMPIERTAALMEVRRFLNSLTTSSEVSDEIKRQATRALRHYPSAREVNMLAEKEGYIRRMGGTVPAHLLITARLDETGRIQKPIEEDCKIRT
ncbi:hypothetical protein DBO86_10210 [Pseudomonas indoloxydans]|uniref:Uncharacterized protein n=1 Tax=Ectopseudomonas oleovorans TaxID=301 RepID=A0A2T5PNA4_ECTOL|nr:MULTISPECIES: BPSL0761 family protein [Pseudomonadaceae]MCQ2035908.1 hypothetical protein [Stutzerimonas kunmingensis]OWK47862.1 hypothetical protein PSOLE_14270 [Pseudomonas oleovorans subsp. oleovorans]PTU79172.1 hypothetical protein DBO86_10210 [Pseudomonas indoloxydans]QKP88623.1 hypothetical protein MS095_21670 [Pseudomonas aeruginosa]QKP89011.1 hypothetical protein MS095_23760 [Pseudomonas aeruginosa]